MNSIYDGQMASGIKDPYVYNAPPSVSGRRKLAAIARFNQARCTSYRKPPRLRVQILGLWAIAQGYFIHGAGVGISYTI